jgi:cytochrome c oxidase subunit 2
MEVWAQYRVISNFPEQARRAPIAEVTARQFEWRIRYPEPGHVLKTTPEKHDLYSVNELLVPAGRPVMIYLRTQDVQHSFFVPKLRVKQDAVPGQIIPVWFEVIEPGEYELVCAELCGWGHYKMKARVVALPEHEYEAAIEALEKEQAFDGTALAGDSEDEE